MAGQRAGSEKEACNRNFYAQIDAEKGLQNGKIRAMIDPHWSQKGG
jgi:hypothetical protein